MIPAALTYNFLVSVLLARMTFLVVRPGEAQQVGETGDDFPDPELTFCHGLGSERQVINGGVSSREVTWGVIPAK